MKNRTVDVFVELGRRLEAFGDDGDPLSDSPDARRAALSLARRMLSREALECWLLRYPELNRSFDGAKVQKNILIITAGNIPFVGVHDLLCVLAAGHRALVKPSSRDAARMAWVVGQLIDIQFDMPVLLVSEGDDIGDVDAVVAMGSDDTVRALRVKYAGLPVLLRGHRSSLAVLSGTETSDELSGLVDDILAYSGLGCRNVSLVFVPREYDFTMLQNAMNKYISRLDLKYHNNYRQARALLEVQGRDHVDCGSCLLVEASGFSNTVSVLHYAFYDALSEVIDWVREHDFEIQCIAVSPRFMRNSGEFSCGSDGQDFGLSTHPRAVVLGRTQCPEPADYPDGVDTIKFLLSI